MKNSSAAKMKLVFGNVSDLVDRSEASETVDDCICHQKWTMLLSINNDEELTSKYVKSVRYHLHPGYKNHEVQVYDAPFLLVRKTSSTFIIGCDIIF